MLTPLQKLLKNVRDLGKLIVAKGVKKLPKVQKIAQSDHTGRMGASAINLIPKCHASVICTLGDFKDILILPRKVVPIVNQVQSQVIVEIVVKA